MSSDLFDPRADMDSDYSRPPMATSASPFNDSNFSDRILQIEIVGGSSDCRSDGEGDLHQHRRLGSPQEASKGGRQEGKRCVLASFRSSLVA